MNKYNDHINKYNGINSGNFNIEHAFELAIKTADVIMKQGELGDFDLQQITI